MMTLEKELQTWMIRYRSGGEGCKQWASVGSTRKKEINSRRDRV